jgi:hypothetical protein
VEGFMKTEKAQGDHRQKLLTLTRQGQKALEKIDKAANTRFEAALEQLSEQEQQIVLQGIQLFGKALHRARRLPARTSTRTARGRFAGAHPQTALQSRPCANG